MNDLVGATATRATVWAVEREFSYWDATPVVSHINLRTAIAIPLICEIWREKDMGIPPNFTNQRDRI